MHDQGSNARISELDGLRGLAIVFVLLWHFVGALSGDDIVRSLTIWGRTGVDFFFVLSGFLIIGILVDERDSKHLLKVFYWRRFMRIYPPYAMLIALYWLCYVWVGESPAFNTNAGAVVQLLAQVTFTWNWLMAVTDSAVARGFSVTWSVAIEEWFYLIAPWVMIATPRRYLVPLLLAIGATSILARGAAHLLFGANHSLAPYVLPPFRLDGFCAGGLLALAMRNKLAKQALLKHASKAAKCALAFVISTPLTIAVIQNDLDRQMYLWGHTYLTVGYAIVLLWAIQSAGEKRTKWLRVKALTEAGRYSYTLYLFHPLFISLCFTLAGKQREIVASWQDVLLAVSAFVVSLLFSIVFYWAVEKRALALGKRMAYRDAAFSGERQATQS
ncbi:acyltransferase [Devosia sp. ZB163]|uniref:acyltransferase family protein n=1 Tax=Devosia sp. ZB163 TaxID=3025938 RepID=UPI00235E38A2|nr:acyltransferase [Devosia sp. ZB163]MDC9823040.1 acyltransferase [Devosia sp. ZB163]